MKAPKDGFARDERLRDFRNFLYLVWKHTVGVPPTELQYDFAHYLQTGPDHLVLEAYRGFGKSVIASAFCAHTLYWNPEKNIFIASASKQFADDIATFVFQIFKVVPGMEFLSSAGRERHSKIAFDVGPAPASKHPSVKSVGITGQVTGSRGDLVLSDDVETLSNSLTQAGRDLLLERIKEYDAIVKPGGRVVFLETHQTEQSIYNALPQRGYTVRQWPIEYPDEGLLKRQWDTLAPVIRDAVAADPSLAGEPTDPTRFGPMELAKRRASYGRSGYALQFKLDASLADVDRYPLKLKDLIIHSVDTDVAPGKLVWSGMPSNELRDLPAVGFAGDRFYQPLVPERTEWFAYQGSVMTIDPSGTGKDETAVTVVKHLHGMLYCPCSRGLPGGYSDATMVAIAETAKRHKVGLIRVETNFGDGMFEKLLQPHLQRIYPCTVESIRATTQKERRIIDTLEPVLQQHRLVIDPSVVEGDGWRTEGLSPEQAVKYQLFYQLTRITTDRGCLAHDDRLDSLAMAVGYWLEALARDVDTSLQASTDEAFEGQLKLFMDNLLEPPELTQDPRGRVRGGGWLGTNRATGGGVRRGGYNR